MATGTTRTALMLLAAGAVGFLAAHLSLRTNDAEPAEAAPAQERDSSVMPRQSGQPVTVNAPAVPDAPAAATSLADILRIPSDFEQTAALYELIRYAGAAQLERLIEETDTVPGASDRQAALSILYGRYADLDPDAAVAFLERRGRSHSDVELRAIFHAWARMDLTAAVEAAASLPAQWRGPAAAAILSSRDDISTQAQRDIARRLDVEHLLTELAMRRSMDQVDRDPRSAWQAALSGGNASEQYRQLASVARGWADQDPLAALEAVASLDNAGLRVQIQSQVLHQWSRRHPREAVDWAISQPASPQRRQLTSMALAGMAESEPRMAFDIAQTLTGVERTEALGQVLNRWAADDPAAAARAVDAVSGQARQNIIGRIASAYAGQDPQAAINWISGLDPQEAIHGTMMTFSVLAHQDPGNAASLVSRLPDVSSRSLAAGTVAQQWAQHDPEAAAVWVDSLAEEQVRSRAAGNLVSQWARFDRDGALGYAERIPAAAERDAALVSMIQSQSSDIAFAEGLFERLSDPGQRALAARQLYFSLREREPERAQRYRELAGFGRDENEPPHGAPTTR